MWRHIPLLHNITPLFYPGIGADNVRGFSFLFLLQYTKILNIQNILTLRKVYKNDTYQEIVN